MGDPVTLDGLLTRSAARRPRHAAIVAGERRLDYASFDAAVSALAAGLRARVGGRAVIAVSSVLDPDFAVAYYGAVRAGHTLATINPLVREADLAHVLGSSHARVALLDEGLLERLAAVRDRLPDLELVVPLGEAVAWPGADDGALGTGVVDSVVSSPDDVACLHFTSGTTGLPKAVQLTHRNLVVNARQVAKAHGLDDDSISLNNLPTYHPMHLNSAVFAGATQVLCADGDPAGPVHEANRRGATHFYSLPFRLARLAADPRLPELRLETVTRIASGGSALSPDSAARLTAHFGVPVFQGYGLAETSPLTHSDDPLNPVHGSVGPPVAETECRVVDVETRQVLADGKAGEVQVRGPQVMKGYLGFPDGTGLEPDGWLSTGDVGRIGPDGRLYLTDRLKDVFKYHNWLISPTEVERALGRHPLVADCVVFDHPEEPAGAVPHALVVLKDGDGAPDERLRSVCVEVNVDLPYFQQIRFAQALEAIPRSPNGKVQRRALRDRHLGQETVALDPVGSEV